MIPRNLESAISRIIELGEEDFGFRRYGAQADAFKWACGTMQWGTSEFNYEGVGRTPVDAAWALVGELEKARAL